MEFRDVRGLTARLAAAGVTAIPYDISGVRAGTHLGISSPTATLIVDLHDGLVLTGPSLPTQTRFSCCIGGLHLRPFTIHHNGTQRGVQLALTPAAVRRLFGMPVGELGEATISLDSLDPGLSARLRSALGDVSHDARHALTVDLLADAVAADSTATIDTDAFRTWDAIVHSRGRITVSELVERSGWSARHLTGMFTAEFGFGPKQAARLVRFDAARTALDRGRTAADVAADLGYADQAHLSREFTDFLDLSPRAYLAAREAEFTPA